LPLFSKVPNVRSFLERFCGGFPFAALAARPAESVPEESQEFKSSGELLEKVERLNFFFNQLLR